MSFVKFDSCLPEEGTTKYKLIDTDFEEIIIEENQGWEPVFKTYEKHGHDVARNLVLAFLWYGKKNRVPMQIVVQSIRNSSLKFHEYEKEIEKYLVLV